MYKEINWEKLEKDMDRILVIVNKFPDNLQEKAFDFIKELVLTNIKEKPINKTEKTKGEQESVVNVESSRIPQIHGNVLAMLRKNNLDKSNLEKIFMIDHDPILPIYKVVKRPIAKAQMQKIYMILLENAINSGQFKASYSEVRNTCKDEGLFDGNFTLNLRKEYEKLSGAVTKDSINEDADIVLLPQGYQRLAEIINELSN